MTSAVVLKHLSNLLLIASVVALVLAIVNSSVVLYVVAGVLFVDSFVVASIKRRQFRQSKATGPSRTSSPLSAGTPAPPMTQAGARRGRHHP